MTDGSAAKRPGRQAAIIGRALLLGSLGGLLAASAGLPLPWMIGSMLAATGAAMSGIAIALPTPLRNLFVVVLGVMLGSGFTPAILERLDDWALSLATLLVYSALAGAAGAAFFRRFAGYDRTTAYFAGMPGGLSEMVLVGEAMGGDARIISMTHAARVLLVVLALPFAFQLLHDVEPAAGPALATGLAAVAWRDLAVLALCGLIGALGARALRLPAAFIIGPMVLSAAVHLAGWTAAAPPGELVAAAQVVVGTAIGCRFAGAGLALIRRSLVVAAGGTVILVATTLLIALALHAATGLPTDALILAFAPGGLAEMSLVAVALGMDAAFVATHHIVRIFLIVTLAPPLFRSLARRRSADGD